MNAITDALQDAGNTLWMSPLFSSSDELPTACEQARRAIVTFLRSDALKDLMPCTPGELADALDAARE